VLTQSQALCVVQFAVVWTGVAHGNGKAMALISSENLVHVQKVRSKMSSQTAC
jgi:hypothetical protein